MENLLCEGILGLYYDFSTRKLEKIKIRIGACEWALWRIGFMEHSLLIANRFFLENKQKITKSSTSYDFPTPSLFVITCNRLLS